MNSIFTFRYLGAYCVNTYKRKSKVSKMATAGKKTIAVRIPKHKVARNLLKILKVPLAAPSANIASKLSPTCANDVVDEFGDKIKFILLEN